MFALLNSKWGDPTFGTPSGEISWSSELNGDLAIAAGFDLDDIEGALRTAFDTWESVAAVDFEEVELGGAVTVSNAVLDWPVVGVAGPTPANPSDFLPMTFGQIIFSQELINPLTMDEFAWSPTGGGGTIDFFAVALHEIGHIIGLDHPGDPTQVMNAVIQVDELGLGDIQGAQFLYGTDGDDVPVEPGTPINAAELGLSGGGGGGGGGLILGLLALVAAFFTGGASLAFAAAQFARSDDDDDMDDPAEGPIRMDPSDVAAIFNSFDDCGHGTHGDEAYGQYHGVTVAELLPQIDFTQQPNPCGCVGLCGHIIDMDDEIDDALI